MNMIATVLQVNRQGLLVRDDETGQEVQVNMRNGNRFSVGDRVRIAFSGQMTSSIPPQISATSVQRLRPSGPEFLPPPGPSPSPGSSNEVRGVITQRGRNFLMVRENRTGQQYRVEYVFAHHFCVRQQVIVRYDTITLSNPPRVTATDITPIC